jgi:hypothetical protein
LSAMCSCSRLPHAIPTFCRACARRPTLTLCLRWSAWTPTCACARNLLPAAPGSLHFAYVCKGMLGDGAELTVLWAELLLL